jgi:hypothetical protein
LLRSALETPIEVIMKRRLYAIETWLAIGGLAIYLAVTELLPRKLGKQQPKTSDGISESDDES